MCLAWQSSENRPREGFCLVIRHIHAPLIELYLDMLSDNHGFGPIDSGEQWSDKSVAKGFFSGARLLTSIKAD